MLPANYKSPSHPFILHPLAILPSFKKPMGLREHGSIAERLICGDQAQLSRQLDCLGILEACLF